MKVAQIGSAVAVFGLPSACCATLCNCCEIRNETAALSVNRFKTFLIFVATYFIYHIRKSTTVKKIFNKK